ncbi:ABC transporter permease [Terrarubrum flagellatum]|uniref:ABC transporter permease n=1 Tax=Terrirubrum flagellatum TaxID=2895980 RepID=UPI003145136F
MGYYLSLISFGPSGWGGAFLDGALITISLAVATLPFGLALGLGIALMQRSEKKWVRRIATIYTTIFRGVPELLTLYIIYFGLSLGAQRLAKSLGFSGQFDMPPFLAGMIALGLVLSSFSSEVWVGALSAIPKGQREAAAALGLHRGQAFRLVVFPQLMRVALPGLGNNWMVLLKETSLVSVITLPDIMFYATRANVVTKEPFLMFGVACLIYLVFSMASAIGFGFLEARANRGYISHGTAR